MKNQGNILFLRESWARSASLMVICLGGLYCAPLAARGSDLGGAPARSDVDSETNSTKLLMGMSTALSGPAADLGTSMRLGVETAIREANSKGLFEGKTIELLTLDDGYEPSRTAPNMHKLIDEHNVLAIIGNVGTPTAVTAIPIARAQNVPFFGAFTGASLLRNNPKDRMVINYRATYAQEAAAMVDGLVWMGVKPEEIAFFTQDDSFGDDGFFGGLKALRNHAEIERASVAHGRYPRNSLHVESGLADLLLHEPLPKAVIMVGTYAPCTKLVKLAHENDYRPIFLANSFVGAEPLIRGLGEEAEGMIVTQVVPHHASDLPVVKEYRTALEQQFPDEVPSFVGLEGYLVGRIMIRALQQIEGEVTRAKITDSLEQLGEFDIGLDFPLTLGVGDRQASDRVWPVRLTGKGSRPMTWDDAAIKQEGNPKEGGIQ